MIYTCKDGPLQGKQVDLDDTLMETSKGVKLQSRNEVGEIVYYNYSFPSDSGILIDRKLTFHSRWLPEKWTMPSNAHFEF